MTTRSVLAISVLAAVLSTGLLFAEAEGNGDFFLSHAAAQATGGSRFARVTWTDGPPRAAGSTVQASSLTAVEPDAGGEAPGLGNPGLGNPGLGNPGHHAQPLASGLGRGAVVYAQAASLSRFLASRGGSGPGGH